MARWHEIAQITQRTYQSSLSKWIIPYLGEMQLGKITKSDIRAWVQKIKADDAGTPAIHKAFKILSAVFRTALEDDMIKANPCKGVKLPSITKPLKQIMTYAEYQKLLAEIPDRLMFVKNRYGPAATVTLAFQAHYCRIVDLFISNENSTGWSSDSGEDSGTDQAK
jgi:site-specific recombinase XerD